MRIMLQDGAGTTFKQDTETKGIGPCSALVTSLAAGIYYLRVEPHTPGSASAAMQFDYRLVVTVR